MNWITTSYYKTPQREELERAKAAAIQAADQNAQAEILELESGRNRLETQYGQQAREAYISNRQDQEAMANSLTSAGLYRSGYSDSARVASQSAYREQQHQLRQDRNTALQDLEAQLVTARLRNSADRSELEAQYDKLLAQQAENDRDFFYQQNRDAVEDARYTAQTEREAEEEAYRRAQEAAEREYQLQRDKIADQRYATEQERKAQQDALERAYDAAEIGDFSLLREMGIDTAAQEALFASKQMNDTGAKSIQRVADTYGLDTAVARLVVESGVALAETCAGEGKTLSQLMEALRTREAELLERYGENGLELLWDVAIETFSAQEPESAKTVLTAKGYLDYLDKRLMDGELRSSEANRILDAAPISETEKDEIRSILNRRLSYYKGQNQGTLENRPVGNKNSFVQIN